MSPTILIADPNPENIRRYRSLLRTDHEKNPIRMEIFPDTDRLRDYFCTEYKNGRRIPLSILNAEKDFAQGCRTAGLLMNTDPATMIILISDGSDLSSQDRQYLKPGIYYIEQTVNNSKKLFSMTQTLLRNWNEREQLHFRLNTPPAPKYPPSVLFPNRKQIFDEEGVAERMGKSRKMTRMMLKTFIQNIPKQTGRLRKHLNANDAEAVWKTGHTLKGSAATAGATAMRDIAMQIENAGKAGKLEEAAWLLYHLETAFEELKQLVAEIGLLADP